MKNTDIVSHCCYKCSLTPLTLTPYAAGSGTISFTVMRPVSTVASAETGTATSPAVARPSPGTLKGEESSRIRRQAKPDPHM